MSTAPPQTGNGSPYAHLLHQIRGAGLLERRTGYYIWKIAITGLLFAAGWAAFALIGDSWWVLIVAGFLAFVFTPLGFLGHDAGHRQIFASRRANYLLGLLHSNLGIGVSYGWGGGKHKPPHAHPNTDGADPDLEIRALAFTSRQAGNRGRIAAFAYRYQAFFFFPLLLLEGLSLHVNSARALLRRGGRPRAWESVLLASHVIGYLGAVFLILSPVRAVVFILVQQGMFGLYLGCSFAPNHKGMAILAAGDRTDFLRRQVLTSRNVRGHWLTDFLLGGLNYQIEHHLFPSMPRSNLRHAQTIVESFCHRHSLTYCQTGLFESYAQALRHLHAVGRTPCSAGA
ncbi:acyl-CoA desaturase [Micromonospora sp. MP36]|uniref:fatty acid desaturase family protein n=1 Tax=Micromonospora sp. MP36 TaxID=2604468 RepID=UPI0011D7C623|nr:acyl-CoA desaturase [Micromonospora sp. MP36]TYC22976.1 acyl-CoA desaturase [Micromonospora sp. MP36]